MVYDYSDCAQARQCGTRKSRNHTPWYLLYFHKCHYSMQKVAGTVKKNPMVYLTTFVRPSLTRVSTIGVRYIMGFYVFIVWATC